MFFDGEWDGRGHGQVGSHEEIGINQPSEENAGISFIPSTSKSSSVLRA